ncbi:MAG: protein kinase, partial [Rickettsia endosymbiont of Ixodes persulcatus]|nr:protein kinase [Rickettsia endosymbiont of Ixodes persulcatus]
MLLRKLKVKLFAILYNVNFLITQLKLISETGNKGFEKICKEVDLMVKINSEYVVNCINAWIENNNCLCIQMELCSDDLKNIITSKAQAFGRQDSEPMNAIEYFISCQIFAELLECVQYLHESKPPIIHRDLKPANVLIVNNTNSKRFLRLCDLGLATTQDMVSMYHT